MLSSLGTQLSALHGFSLTFHASQLLLLCCVRHATVQGRFLHTTQLDS